MLLLSSAERFRIGLGVVVDPFLLISEGLIGPLPIQGAETAEVEGLEGASLVEPSSDAADAFVGVVMVEQIRAASLCG